MMDLMLKYNATHQLRFVGVQQKMETKYLAQANEEKLIAMKVSLKRLFTALSAVHLEIENRAQPLN